MRRLAVLLSAAAILSACAPTSTDSGAPQPTGAPAPVSSTVSASASASADVPANLRFTATTVDGAAFDGASLAGRPVVMWFWAAWCPKCRAAADDVAAIDADFGDKVTVLGVAGLNSGGEVPMRKFVADTGVGGFAHLSDDAGAIWKRFGVISQQYFVVLDASGAIAYSGSATPAQLREKVSALVV